MTTKVIPELRVLHQNEGTKLLFVIFNLCLSYCDLCLSQSVQNIFNYETFLFYYFYLTER